MDNDSGTAGDHRSGSRHCIDNHDYYNAVFQKCMESIHKRIQEKVEGVGRMERLAKLIRQYGELDGGIEILAVTVEGMDHVDLVEDLEDTLEDELSYMGEGS